MDLNERQKLRNDCLETSYNNYFSGQCDKQGKQFDLKKENELEMYLAIKYLIGKGFIKLVDSEDTLGHLFFTLTSEGIDAAEEILKK